MTKEEQLKQEAEEYAEQCYGWTNNDLALDVAKATYITSAEPREKQITGLSKHILELQKDKGNLIDRVKELEAQIEKMKCCGNCVHFDFTEPNYCHKGVYRANQNVCGKWCFGN